MARPIDARDSVFIEELTWMEVRDALKAGKDTVIVATGGVDTPDKALAVLDAGATAVSYFTGFITRGPILARRILDALVARARR